jgi:UDP-glucuronate decarboxylase
LKYFIEQDIKEIIDRLDKSLPKLDGKKILITGAGGFLGRYFIALLKSYNTITNNPVSIVALDNHITSNPSKAMTELKLDVNVEWIYGDATLGSQLPDKFDYILHAAGIASPEHYRAKPLETIDVAVNVTRVLLEKAKSDGSRVLFFSSSEIYGDPLPEFVPTNEDYRGHVASRGPRACYDESKRLGETLCWIYEHYFGVHVSVARPFNVFGPGMMPKDFRVMPNFAASIARGESLKVYGHGKQTRTFCYISDAIVGFMKIILDAQTPDVFNVGNPNPEISILDLANMVERVASPGIKVDVIKYPETYPEDEPNRRCPNIDRIQSRLGFKPEITLEEGVARFFEWSKNNYSKDLL